MTTEPGHYSYREITTQAASWKDALATVLRQRPALEELLEANRQREHLYIGCGSTHYLALFVAPYTQALTGRACRAAPSSEVYWQTNTLVTPGSQPLAVALSRSGETSETIMAVNRLRERGSDALTISCYGETGLSEASSLTVEIAEGREESFAQTRSFAGMLVASQAVAALAAGNAALLADLSRLPGLAAGLITRAAPVAERIGQDEGIRRITYLGSGPLYGLANEATVKMKEMSLSLAEPYHFMEFRHGPMSLVDREHLVVALLSEGMRDYELGVLDDLRERGARLVVVGNRLEGLKGEFDAVLDLQADLPERAYPVLYLPFVQLLAYYRALGRGLNPDRPRNVVMSIRLDGSRLGS